MGMVLGKKVKKKKNISIYFVSRSIEGKRAMKAIA